MSRFSSFWKSAKGSEVRSLSKTALMLAVGLCAAPGSRASEISIGAAADNTLYERADGGTSNGSGPAMFAGRNSGATDSIRRGLIRFDLAWHVPRGSTITGATLRLWNSAANESPALVTMHRVLESWGEGASSAGGPSGGGGGAPAAPDDATWVHRRFSELEWSTVGGSFESGASAGVIVEGAGWWAWSSAQLIADAQAMVDDPAADFGWILTGDETFSNSAKRFATRESSEESLRPQLIIEYVVPAPAVWLPVAALSAFAPGRRRRV